MADEILMKDLPEKEKSFDIHGGGNDLQFPHHENEIAQSMCAHPEGGFANYWMHNEMLQVEGKKMSKSLGNFFTVHDLLEQGVPGEVIRFVFLSTHYRKPMDWTEKKAKEAEMWLRKWHKLTDGILPTEPDEDLLSELASDLNTASVLGNLKAMTSRLEGVLQLESYGTPELARSSKVDGGTFVATAQLLGLLLPDQDKWWLSPDVDFDLFQNRLSEARVKAMQSKDFTELDRLKTTLINAGVEVKMSKEGVTLAVTSDFDPSKLEALK